MESWLFTQQGFVPTQRNSKLLVADSFLLVDGQVRSIDKHLDRFRFSVALKHPVLEQEAATFFEAALKMLPKSGTWFPRLALTSVEPESFVLTLRQAPEITDTVILWTYPKPDPRQDLSVKGPELQLGATIRDQAIAQGADEAILLSADGFISEGSLSSLVWWEGETLVAPSDEIPWLESVTRQEVFEVAQSLGIITQTKKVKPEDLIGKEVWLLSSLQGIRVVKSWLGVSDNFAEGHHVSLFEKRLKLLESHLP